MESGLSFCPAQLSLPMIISFLVATDLSKEVTCANLFCFDLGKAGKEPLLTRGLAAPAWACGPGTRSHLVFAGKYSLEYV
jgi:hypothetical protein